MTSGSIPRAANSLAHPTGTLVRELAIKQAKNIVVGTDQLRADVDTILGAMRSYKSPLGGELLARARAVAVVLILRSLESRHGQLASNSLGRPLPMPPSQGSPLFQLHPSRRVPCRGWREPPKRLRCTALQLVQHRESSFLRHRHATRSPSLAAGTSTSCQHVGYAIYRRHLPGRRKVQGDERHGFRRPGVDWKLLGGSLGSAVRVSVDIVCCSAFCSAFVSLSRLPSSRKGEARRKSLQL